MNLVPSRLGCVLALLLMGAEAWANPVNLEAPANSLGSADLYGKFRLWREIDDVDFGNGLSIPLRIEFSAARNEASPYLGHGWWIPLVEARAYLKRESMMQATLLCGKSMFLRRTKADPNKFLTLDKEWTGVIDGDAITISRADGWELRYRQGRIHQLKTDTGRVLTWVRNGDLVTEVREEGSANAPLRLSGSNRGNPEGFEVNGRKHRFSLEQRPRVQVVNGQNLLGGFDPSLATWTWPDKTTETYTFEVERPALAPNLKLKDREGVETAYLWDAQSGNIVSDGEWTYQIGKITEEFGLPRITRKNKEGRDEFIVVDNAKGITEEKTLEGGHKVTEVYKSPGPLYGKVRKIEQVGEKGVRTLFYAASYDEVGRLIRETNASGITTAYTFDKDGKYVGKKALPVRDKNILKALEAKEALMKKAVAEAVGDSAREDMVQELAFFYIGDSREPEKALALTSQLNNRRKVFAIKLGAVNHNDAYGYAEKMWPAPQKLIHLV